MSLNRSSPPRKHQWARAVSGTCALPLRQAHGHSRENIRDLRRNGKLNASMSAQPIKATELHGRYVLTESHRKRNVLMKDLAEKLSAEKPVSVADALAQYHRIKAKSSRLAV